VRSEKKDTVTSPNNCPSAFFITFLANRLIFEVENRFSQLAHNCSALPPSPFSFLYDNCFDNSGKISGCNPVFAKPDEPDGPDGRISGRQPDIRLAGVLPYYLTTFSRHCSEDGVPAASSVEALHQLTGCFCTTGI